jgi:two-component system cell cycle sensor histidine kinase PleC
MFGSVRIFVLSSLLVIILIAVFSGTFFRTIASEDLIQLVEKNNAGIADGYITGVWKRYRDTIVPLAVEPAKLAGNPQVALFAQDTVRYFQKMALIRVNVYSAAGALLMSDNVMPVDRFLGAAASPDAAFVTAQIKHEGAISQLLPGIALQSNGAGKVVQTIYPIPAADGSRSSEGMIEILYNMSEPWYKMLYFQVASTGGIIVLFLVFIIMLAWSSRKAEMIIARQHESNLELSAAAAAAVGENQNKSLFLANISHELRTPLNAIIGFSEVLKNELMPKVVERKYDQYVVDINSSGVHLLSLINDILDYSKAEAGKLALEPEETNINKLIQNSMRLVATRAEEAQVRLIEDTPKEPLIMVVDGKKLKQVLLNLLSNAVKFTPAGGAIKTSAWYNVGDDTIGFEVRDNGIGIGPKDISRAMAPFGQVDNTLKRKYEGTGLGLPLTKKFVELMGGKFMIESELDKGTTITFSLPREIKSGNEGLK